jgi:hypothetical protein
VSSAKKVKFGLWVAVGVLGAAGVASATVVGRPESPPRFARGGGFAAAGLPARPAPYTLSAGAVVQEPVAGPTTSAPVPAPAGRPASPSGNPTLTTTTTARSTTSDPSVATAETARPEPAGLRLPAVGTYTYAVDGTEAASGFGERRYPAEMVVSVHGGEGLRADEVVLDQRFSDEHEERLILRLDGDDLTASFEGGSITFGPGTQTSQADYRPPMLLVPVAAGAAPPGTARTGSSEAVADGGAVSRVEDWTVTVVGREVVDVLGAPTPTWVVRTERQSRPGSAEQVTRVRTAWYDPARGLWVRWTERFDGHRSSLGLRFSYTSSYTATLRAESPAT